MLSDALEQARRGGERETPFLRNLDGAPRVVLTFDDNSADLKTVGPWVSLLGNAAQTANRVYLHGHTDAFVATEAGTQSAIRRAVEVRHLLISLKVEPQRIRLFYRGAGNFIANNSTVDGKALNRRVEIELRKW